MSYCARTVCTSVLSLWCPTHMHTHTHMLASFCCFFLTHMLVQVSSLRGDEAAMLLYSVARLRFQPPDSLTGALYR